MLYIKLQSAVKVNGQLLQITLLSDNQGVKLIEKKIFLLKEKFSSLTAEERYLTLIEMGKNLPPYPQELKKSIYIVRGCQSTLYLHAQLTESGALVFQADADALISKGLAALLISIYSNELPGTILETPPSFLSEAGILPSLSPSRSNGLAYLYKRIRDVALSSFSEAITSERK